MASAQLDCRSLYCRLKPSDSCVEFVCLLLYCQKSVYFMHEAWFSGWRSYFPERTKVLLINWGGSDLTALVFTTILLTHTMSLYILRFPEFKTRRGCCWPSKTQLLLYVLTGLTFKNLFCPRSGFTCFMCIWEQTETFLPSTTLTDLLITERECVYCAVWTVFK